MSKSLVLLFVLLSAGSASAAEVGEKSIKTAMVMSSVLPGAGQFYLGNAGKGFLALGGELGWWAGAGLFFLGGHMAGREARQDTTLRADSLRALETAMYVGSGLFAAIALGWRALMVLQVHDAAVAKNYRHRFLDVRVGLAPGLDGIKVGLTRHF